MKVQFYLDSNANADSSKESGWFDTVEDLGYEVGEWEALTDEDKFHEAQRWATEYIGIWYEERE